MDSESPLSNVDEIIDVMIVDDAPIIRKLYSRMLEHNPYVDIVAVAENGLEALIQQRAHNIDVVVLDIEMPVMNGLQALEQLLHYDSHVMVVIASTLNWENAEITHIALSNGAADYLEKPSAVRRNLNAEQFQDYMNEKILTLGLKRKKILLQEANYSEAITRKRQQIQKKKPSDAVDGEADKPAKGVFVNEVNYQPAIAPKAEKPNKKPQKNQEIAAKKEESLQKKPDLSQEKPKEALQPLNKLVASPESQRLAVKNFASIRKASQSVSSAIIANKKLDAQNIERQRKILREAHESVSFTQEQATLRALPKNFSPKAIAIGASTGGPPLIQKLIPELARFHLPIFLTQHMPDFFTSVLAEQISKRGGVNALEVREDMIVESTDIYIAHGGNHLGVRRKNGKIIAYEDKTSPPEHCCKPSVDVMLKHMINVYQGDILLVILTGMGRDGSIHSRTLADKGGVIVVQDEQSSLIWGMPGSVMKQGVASAALPPHEIYDWCRQIVPSA